VISAASIRPRCDSRVYPVEARGKASGITPPIVL